MDTKFPHKEPRWPEALVHLSNVPKLISGFSTKELVEELKNRYGVRHVNLDECDNVATGTKDAEINHIYGPAVVLVVKE